MPPSRRAHGALVAAAAALALAWAPARAQPTTAFERAKAEALLRDHLPCLGCHAVGSLGGGRLAPDLADVASRRPPVYVAAMIDDPQRVVPGTAMPRTPMPASTRALLVRYLTRGATTPGTAAPGAAAAPAGASARAPADTSGARLYARFCAGCHGARGAGDGPNARFLPVPPTAHASGEEMARRTDDRLYDAIAAGGASLGRSPRMPAFGATLSPAQTWALVRHLRALCACEGPAWSADGAPPRRGGTR